MRLATELMRSTFIAVHGTTRKVIAGKNKRGYTAFLDGQKVRR
jgi:hypothetical protein